jgi:ATP-dependent 26S proteasome regulatory subunit
MKKQNKKSNNNAISNLQIASKVKLEILDGLDMKLANDLTFKLYIKNSLMNKPLKLNQNFEFTLFQKKFPFTIVSSNLENDDDFVIGYDTDVEIVSSIVNDFEKLSINDKNEDSNNIDIGILKKLVENLITVKNSNEEEVNKFSEDYLTQIDKIIKQSHSDSELPNSFIYKGIVINGPQGVGKSFLIQRIIHKYSKHNINFLQIAVADLLSKNDKEEYIKKTFKFAQLLKPAIIVFEDIDKLFSLSDDGEGSKKGLPTQYNLEDAKTKLLLCLINEIDSITYSDKVIILASTCNYDRLEMDLKKNGRFDYVITMAPPKQAQRKYLLQIFAKSYKHHLTDEDFETLADKSHGFVADDIIQIFKKAQVLNDSGESLGLKLLEATLRDIKPISLKDIIVDVPKVLWNDIGGNKDVISKIRQSIEWPLKHPEAFKKIGISPPNVIINIKYRVYCYMDHLVAVRQ